MSDVYEHDLRAATRVLDGVKAAIGDGDVYIAPGTIIYLANGNGYPVGRWEMETDENWKFTPHDDNEVSP